MASGIKTVTLGYSNNGGSSFTTQALTVHNYQVVKLPLVVKTRLYAYNWRMEEKCKQRYRVRFVLDDDNFDEAGDPSETKWLFLQAFSVGGLRRLYCADNLDTHTIFNSASNTNYLVWEGEPPSFEEEDRGRRAQSLSMLCRDVV
jgi:hypothetical protein